jgi:tyrosine-specific transport protein
LPILVANIGFPVAVLIMVISWALMTYTALLVCEINLALDDGISFAGMAKKLLGSYGKLLYG